MPKNKFWQFRAATTEKPAELLLYGEIASDSFYSDDDVTPKQFKAELDALGNISALTVYINSPGGSVFAGQAIHSMLARHPARVTMIVDGIAASIASVIVMAGDEIIMPRNAMMMIHNAMSFGLGNADYFRKLADSLDKIGESIIAAYQSKSRKTVDEIKAIMDAETWFTAEDAIAAGFADKLEATREIAASLRGDRLFINGQQMDLSRFQHAPKVVADSKQPVIHAFRFYNGVVPPDVSEVKAPMDEAWEKPALKDFTDKGWADLSDTEKRNIAGHYAWAEEMPPETFGALKLPHHDPKNGHVNWKGVVAAAARLNQADIPDADMPKVKAHLGHHYQQFGETPPWEETDNSLAARVRARNLELKLREA